MSLNFDAAVLPLTSRTAHEEDEAAEDEKIKEKELQDLLTNAFDDLIEDDEDADSERNADSVYSDNYSRDGHQRGSDVADRGGGGIEFLPADYSDAATGFRPLEPYTGDTAGDLSGSRDDGGAATTDSQWEDQYYVDRLGEFDQDGQLVVDGAEVESGGELSSEHNTSQASSRAAGNWFEENKVDEVAVLVRQHPTDRPEALVHVEFARATSVVGGTIGSEESHRFFGAGQNGENNVMIKYQQLHILYSAKGRELQRLQQSFEEYQREWNEESADLRSQLSQAKDNEQDYAEHLREYREKLTTSNNEMAELRGEMRAMEMKLNAVTDNRKELLHKLQAAESTIESLQSHIGDLEQSESLTRAKENHSAFVNSLQSRHKDEIYRLQLEMEQLKENLTQSEQQLADLKKNFDRVSHECEATKIEKAETVNRLIRALEQSQQECERQVVASTRTDSNGSSGVGTISPTNNYIIEKLQNELQSAKQELELFQSSSRLGIGGQNATGSQPNLRALENSTPPSNKTGTFRQDSLLTSLKSEVERSLLCLQTKNEQLKRVQSNYQVAQDQLKESQDRSLANEIKLHTAEAKLLKTNEDLKRLTASVGAGEDNAQQERQRWSKEKSALQSELERCRKQLEELAQSKAALNELVRKLKEETESTREAGERATREAVAECREACLRLHADAVAVIRDECRRQIEDTRMDHAARVDNLTREMDNVKSVYVKVCEEKDQLEDRLLKEFQEDKSKEIEHLKKMWQIVKDEEINSVEKKLSAKYRSRAVMTAAANATTNGPSATGEEADSRLAAHLANAKRVWAKEQELAVEEQVLARVKGVVSNFLSGGVAADQSEIAIDEDIEHIKELEKRVHDTESMYKRHVADLEATLRKTHADELERLRESLSAEKRSALDDLAARKEREAEDKVKRARREFETEKERAVRAAVALERTARDKKALLSAPASSSEGGRECCRMAVAKSVAETELRKDRTCEERLQSLATAKDEETREALVRMENKLCAELEQFLVDQKQRYMGALQAMQDSHQKETLEMRKTYDSQVEQLNAECLRLAEKQQQQQLELASQHGRHRQHEAEAEAVAQLRATAQAATDKCRRLEAETSALASEHRRRLLDKESELEQARAKCDDLARSAAERLEVAVAPLTRQVAALQTDAARSRELEDARRTEQEMAHEDLTTRHRTLKDKVRKYHRYVHAKEREFADTLVRLNAEHSSALERIALLRFEVPQMLEEKLDGLRKEFLRAVLDGQQDSGTGGGGIGEGELQAAAKCAGSDGRSELRPVKRMVDDCVVDQLMDKFAQSLKQVHADTLQYLDECSKMATNRVREEIALATCLVSQHLITPSPSDAGRSTSSHPPKPTSSSLQQQQQPSIRQNRHRSVNGKTTNQGLESASTMSSGRGTLVSGSSRSVEARVPVSNNDRGGVSELASALVVDKDSSLPDKYWSSTPYQRDPASATSVLPSNRPVSFDLGGPLWTPKATATGSAGGANLTSELLGRLLNQRLLMSLNGGGGTVGGVARETADQSGKNENRVSRDCDATSTESNKC